LPSPRAVIGEDIRTGDSLYSSPCAAAELPSPYKEAQAIRCTLAAFQFQLYRTPMSAELFGVSRAELDRMLLKVVAAETDLNWKLYPADSKIKKDGGQSWFSWNKRYRPHCLSPRSASKLPPPTKPLPPPAPGPPRTPSQLMSAQGNGTSSAVFGAGPPAMGKSVAVPCFGAQLSLSCYLFPKKNPQ
jgi:hypothetical protein